MKITKRQLRRIIKEEKAKTISENIFQKAIDKVSDFMTGDSTTRGIDPAKAEAQLMDALATFVGSRVQDAVNQGASTEDMGSLFDKAMGTVDKVIDKFAAEGSKVVVEK